MIYQIAVRLDGAELAILDAEVASGRARSRSEAVRRSINSLDRHRRYRDDAAVFAELAKQAEQPYPELAPIFPAHLAELD